MIAPDRQDGGDRDTHEYPDDKIENGCRCGTGQCDEGEELADRAQSPCEWNGFDGALISIGLVSDRGGDDAEFYAVRRLPKRLDPWAAQHVIPVLGQGPEADHRLKERLRAYLHRHEGEEVVADWPMDLAHLLVLLCEVGGRAHQMPLSMRLVKQRELDSECPHNALADARALMRLWRPGC